MTTQTTRLATAREFDAEIRRRRQATLEAARRAAVARATDPAYLAAQMREHVVGVEAAIARYSARDAKIRARYPGRIDYLMQKRTDTELADEGAAFGFHQAAVAVYADALCGLAAYGQLTGREARP